MIVKNESRIIERCLNNVKDLVDCISICDTGSTDDTIEIIEKFMQKYRIPGKVHRHPWQNFGHNRTLSAQAAQQTLRQLDFPLAQTYLLLLDADMVLEIDPAFNKKEMKADSYYLQQKNNDITYFNIRLVKASLPWQSIGVTHEYWSCKTPCRHEKLLTLKIDDREDGGCKGDKLERDIRLLSQGLKDEPDNERYMFYLAQCFKGLKRYEEAISHYKSRIAKGGWKEEVWFSKFMIGDTYQEMGNWDQALYWYLDAFQYNPQRAEPLQKIANYYRQNNQHDLAYLFAKQGSSIPYPKDQFLFVSYPVYGYQFDEEISIAAYYTPFRDEGFAAANRLVLKKDVPKYIKDQTYKNLLFYVQNLKGSYILPLNKDDAHYAIYEYDPSVINKINEENGVCQAIFQDKPSHDFSNFHESGGPIEFDDGYLMIVHECVVDGQCYYLHRFLYLDKNFNIKKLSDPFVFLLKGIEFCCGMTLDPSVKRCIIPIKYEEMKACLFFVDLDTIRSLLKPLP